MAISQQIIDQTLALSHGEAAYSIVETLSDAGFDTWWVGGCVRDMLNKIVPQDIDIATEAHPEKICELFEKTNDTAKSMGNVLVTINGMTFEVTTFREDDEVSDGRHPESVVFGTREQDAKRRDITINAMYWHPISGELYDPFDGQKDLKEKLIRIIGEPAIRIKHDALRLLRVVRFRALIDGQYHPDTFAALKEHAKEIDVLSGTRRLREIEKMLMGPHPARAFEDLWELGILEYILPEIHSCKGIPQPADYHNEGDVWDHMMKIIEAFEADHGIDVRLAALFHDCGKSETFSLQERIRFDKHATISGARAKEALDRLQCPAKRRDKIVWLIKHHMMMTTFLEVGEERKGHWYYHPWFPELLQLFSLDIAGTEPADYSLYKKIEQDYHLFLDTHPLPPKQLLTGDEVMEILGIKPGEQVGELLDALYQAQIKKKIQSKEEAKTYLNKLEEG